MKTYKEVIAQKAPHLLCAWEEGGVHGCPDAYFEGLDLSHCDGHCEACWNSPAKEQLAIECQTHNEATLMHALIFFMDRRALMDARRYQFTDAERKATATAIQLIREALGEE